MAKQQEVDKKRLGLWRKGLETTTYDAVSKVTGYSRGTLHTAIKKGWANPEVAESLDKILNPVLA